MILAQARGFRGRVVLACLALFLAACGPSAIEPSAISPDPSPTSETTLPVSASDVPQTTTPIGPPETGETGGQPEISRTVIMYDYTFQPETMVVPAGAVVHLTVVNRGNHEHAWVLMEKDYVWEEPFDADDSGHGTARITVDVIDGEVLIFTAPSVPGEYDIVCSIVGHVEYGMVGRLIVR